MTGKRMLKAALILLAVLSAYGLVPAGEAAGEIGRPPHQGRLDNMGITVDSANRNADAIRRSQNRATRDINELH